MVKQKPENFGEEDHSGPSRGVVGSEEAARPDSCARMRKEVAQGRLVWLLRVTAGEVGSVMHPGL